MSNNSIERRRGNRRRDYGESMPRIPAEELVRRKVLLGGPTNSVPESVKKGIRSPSPKCDGISDMELIVL